MSKNNFATVLVAAYEDEYGLWCFFGPPGGETRAWCRLPLCHDGEDY